MPFSKLARSILLVLALLCLAACSFGPVYGDREAAAQRYEMTFASTDSRLEQIIYQDLKKYFHESDTQSAILVDISIAQSSIGLANDSVSLDGTMVLMRQDPQGVQDPVEIYKTTRTATATRGSSPQQLANQQAANEVAERAARELSQTLRLTLLSVLATLEQEGLLTTPFELLSPSPST